MDSSTTAQLVTQTRARLQELAQSLVDDMQRLTDERVGALFASTSKILIALDEAYDVAESRITKTTHEHPDHQEEPERE